MRRISGTTEFELTQMRAAMEREAEIEKQAEQNKAIESLVLQFLATQEYRKGELADKIAAELEITAAPVVIYLERMLAQGNILFGINGMLSIPKPPSR